MNKFFLTGIALSTLLLTGCGGSDEKSKSKSSNGITEQLSQKEIVVIFHGYPEDICTSEDLKNEFLSNKNFVNPIISVQPNSVTCQTYGKTFDNETCSEISLGNGQKACVVGTDTLKSNKFIDITKPVPTDIVSDILLKVL